MRDGEFGAKVVLDHAVSNGLDESVDCFGLARAEHPKSAEIVAADAKVRLLNEVIGRIGR